MKKVVLVLVMALLLAACNGDDDAGETPPDDTGGTTTLTADDAETALRALFSGDRQTANGYFCPEQQVSAETAAAFENTEVNSLSCEREEFVMTCVYELSIRADANSEPFERSETIPYLIQDEKLCEVSFPSEE